MQLNNDQVEACRMALEAKRRDMLASQRRADDIIIERVADAIDESVLANERELAVDTLNREATLLRLVTEALKRIAAREYGVCLQCEEPISAKRLAALPWAALCLTCQEAADRENRTPGQAAKSWFSDAA